MILMYIMNYDNGTNLLGYLKCLNNQLNVYFYPQNASVILKWLLLYYYRFHIYYLYYLSS